MFKLCFQVAFRYHTRVYLSWRKVNQVVKLIENTKETVHDAASKRSSVDFLVSMMKGRKKDVEIARGSRSSTCVPVLYPGNILHHADSYQQQPDSQQNVVYGSASDTVVWMPQFREKLSSNINVV